LHRRRNVSTVQQMIAKLKDVTPRTIYNTLANTDFYALREAD
jgi:hypothetical protein